MPHISMMQENRTEKGQLKIQVISARNTYPISGAAIRLSYTGVPETTLMNLTTDDQGFTEILSLDAPPVALSREKENIVQPYAEYTIEVSAPGFEPTTITGIEILSEVLALQDVQLQPSVEGSEEVYVIPAHTLYGTYPPKIPEDEIKPMDETGEIVLSKVVVPEYIVVHD